MKVASEPWFGSVSPKVVRMVPSSSGLQIALLLFRRREFAEHEHEGAVADDGVLVLQVVVQAETLGRQMLADHRHPQVGAALAAERPWPGELEVAGLVGAPLRLGQQLLPVVTRQAALVPIGSGIFAPVIEEADVVVLLLKRLDLRFDEAIELG